MRKWVLASLILTACATRFEPGEDYSDQIKLPGTHRSSKTVVLFLVDGLSLQTLNPELRQGKLPQITKHFLTSANSQVLQAHTSFPSLTFPGISCLLKEAPVFKTGALGNTVLYQQKITRFESMGEREKFSDIMHGENIFTRLKDKGQRSVSLDYGLGGDATVAASPVDINMGLAAGTEDYLYLDQKKLESLKLLLSDTALDEWPEFVFVHLVGLDFLSHQHGSQSSEAFEYLESLDRSLKDVFEILKKAEGKNHQVVSMLTADHGFSPKARRSVNLEKELLKLSPDLFSFNEHRMASVFAKTLPTEKSLQSWSQKLLRKPGLQIVAYRYGDSVQIQSKKLSLHFSYVPAVCPHGSKAISVNDAAPACPESLAEDVRALYYPHFIGNLAAFFQAERRPDLVVIPERATVFTSADGGFHGGPTAEEVLVPLLMRNSTLADPKSTPALWDLLNFL
jgi:hypothetical protein